MSFKEIFQQQQQGLASLANTGTIGLHLVSGPLVGFAIGYGLDRWLDISPWGKLIFLLVGIGAGFLNVYRDTQILLKRLEKEDAERKGALPPEAAAPPASHAHGPTPHAADPYDADSLEADLVEAGLLAAAPADADESCKEPHLSRKADMVEAQATSPTASAGGADKAPVAENSRQSSGTRD